MLKYKLDVSQVLASLKEHHHLSELFEVLERESGEVLGLFVKLVVGLPHHSESLSIFAFTDYALTFVLVDEASDALLEVMKDNVLHTLLAFGQGVQQS